MAAGPVIPRFQAFPAAISSSPYNKFSNSLIALEKGNFMEHQLPPLPYPMDALQPYISQETLEYHYGKHHKAYVDNLNKLIKNTEFENMPLEDIIKKSKTKFMEKRKTTDETKTKGPHRSNPTGGRTLIFRKCLPSGLSLIHISEPKRQAENSYAVFCLKKKKKKK